MSEGRVGGKVQGTLTLYELGGPERLRQLPDRRWATLPAIQEVASSGMADQSLNEQAREAVLKAIIKSAPTVGNSPTGIRDLAEAYALLERNLTPNAGIVHSRT